MRGEVRDEGKTGKRERKIRWYLDINVDGEPYVHTYILK